MGEREGIGQEGRGRERERVRVEEREGKEAREWRRGDREFC